MSFIGNKVLGLIHRENYCSTQDSACNQYYDMFLIYSADVASRFLNVFVMNISTQNKHLFYIYYKLAIIPQEVLLYCRIFLTPLINFLSILS